MDLRSATRLFAALVTVSLPPLILFAVTDFIAGDWLAERGYGPGTVLLIGALLTVLYAGLVTLLAGRRLLGEARSLLMLAERGTDQADPETGLTSVQRRLADTLEERNRQIGWLAEMVRSAPITEDASAVARSMAVAASRLTGDPTWSLAVMGTADDHALAPGVYRADPEEVAPVSEVHRWASTLERSDEVATAGARHAIGPWGAFVIVEVVAGDDVSAVLMAPWEGRPEPSPAELGLLSLLGQHAATAIDHALLYARVQAQADTLNRMAAIQTDFLRSVTHDLQTPLTSIRALADELRGHADPAMHADLDTIAHQADRLRRMVSQLLTVSRLEAGSLTPRQEVFRAEPLIRRTWEALRPDREVTVSRDGADLLMVGDPDRLEQVLWAVLDNANKYSPQGSPVAITLASRTSDDGQELVGEISIRDDGMGMDAETVQRSSEQFFRSDDARRLVPDGSGVGLYAAHGLMRAMGGDIRVTSRLGVGTTVTLSLPAEPALDDAAVEVAELGPARG
jgi:signal transduction histidine kinase